MLGALRTGAWKNGARNLPICLFWLRYQAFVEITNSYPFADPEIVAGYET